MDVEHLGKYRIVGKVGQGAMGVVYKAYDPVLRRFVAIKTLSAVLDREDLRARFRREAQWAGQLSHPNIVTVHDFGEDEGRAFMAMELLEGMTLKRLIEMGPELPAEQKLRILKEVCDGLAFAHARGVVHRDLKPSNIFLQAAGPVKIMDFGLARLTSAEASQPGVLLGTPFYMSPEQFQGRVADRRSDVFAIGVVAYELLSGRRPFEAESLSSLLHHVTEFTPLPLREVCPVLPGTLSTVVDRALAKDPAARFSDAREMRAALDLTANEKDVHAPLADPPEREARFGADTLFSPQLVVETSPLPASSVPSLAAPKTRRSKQWSSPAYTYSKGRLRAAMALMFFTVVAVGGFWHGRASRDPGVDARDALRLEVQSLRHELLESVLVEAQRAAERNDFEAARSRARRALAIDPSNEKARWIEARITTLPVSEDSPLSGASTDEAGPAPAETTPTEQVEQAPSKVAVPSREGVRAAEDGATTEERESLQRSERRSPKAFSALRDRPVSTPGSFVKPPVGGSPLTPLGVAAARSIEPASGPVRVASGSAEAVPLTRVQPEYPAVAARSKTEGEVLLEVEVSASGAPSSVRVLRASPLFEKAAREAVMRWRWQPYVLDGRTVPFVLTLSIWFRLEG